VEEQAGTEVPVDVSPIPVGMYVVVWISVFMAVTWGMMHLFGTHRRNREADDELRRGAPDDQTLQE